MRLTKSTRDAGELAAIYKNTPEVYEISQFFSKKQPQIPMGSQMQEKTHGSGETPESEVFEGSLEFGKAVRGSGGQQGIQEGG